MQVEKRHKYLFLGFLVLLLAISYTYFLSKQHEYLSITTFDECIRAGYDKVLSYPERCVMPGKQFTNPFQKVKEETSGTTEHDYLNQTYILEGSPVTFTNGIGVLPPNNKRLGTMTLSFTNLVVKPDLNSDGKSDTVAMIEGQQNNSNLYYLVSSLGLYKGSTGSNGLYVDSNITFANISVKNNDIVVDYTLSDKSKHSHIYVFKDDILQLK